MFPALAGGFLTTAPPGKPSSISSLFTDPPEREQELREIKEKSGSRGEKERRKIIGAKNTVSRDWLSIRQGQMCFQIEAVV